jgi:2-amino-4-hydroxy-6-hydroxymethyldihydropteridine diphosphokinase
MPDVFIGLGSNLGEREKNCEEAIRLIGESGITVVSRSSMYETEPWGVQDQPLFINMVICVRTEREPSELLRELKVVEKKMGRNETKKWAPRIIDLDILLYDDITVDEQDLKIPHPYMFDREFVIKPLSEIAPEVVRKYNR